MQPTNIQQTHLDISHARLSSYKGFFQCQDPQELYGIYCWNEAISGALFRLISITEVVMRNRFHMALSQHSYTSASVGSPGANDWYNHIRLPQKSLDKIKKVTHRYRGRGPNKRLVLKHPTPSSNDVVSQMSFGFWPKMLDVSLPWGNLLPHIVVGHRHRQVSHWNRTANQDALYARLDLVNRLRNRIAHFEPIWKQASLQEERRPRPNVTPRIISPPPQNKEEALVRLELLHERINELLRWLSPDRAKDYESSYVKNHFCWLCSEDGLAAYRGFQPGVDLPISRFKRELNSLLKHKTMVRVIRNERPHGIFYTNFR